MITLHKLRITDIIRLKKGRQIKIGKTFYLKRLAHNYFVILNIDYNRFRCFTLLQIINLVHFRHYEFTHSWGVYNRQYAYDHIRFLAEAYMMFAPQLIAQETGYDGVRFKNGEILEYKGAKYTDGHIVIDIRRARGLYFYGADVATANWGSYNYVCPYSRHRPTRKQAMAEIVKDVTCDIKNNVFDNLTDKYTAMAKKMVEWMKSIAGETKAIGCTEQLKLFEEV